jgi:hypothetical protein
MMPIAQLGLASEARSTARTLAKSGVRSGIVSADHFGAIKRADRQFAMSDICLLLETHLVFLVEAAGFGRINRKSPK